MFYLSISNQGWELVYVEYGNGVWLGVIEKEIPQVTQIPQDTSVGDALLPLQLSIEASMSGSLDDVLDIYNSVDYWGG